MGVRYPTAGTTGLAPALPANATETQIAISPPINLPLDGALVSLLWFVVITAGTATTAVSFRVRRGSTLASTQFQAGVWTHTLAAGNTACISGNYVDSPGIVAEQQYILTIVQVAATGAGTIVDSNLLAFVL